MLTRTDLRQFQWRLAVNIFVPLGIAVCLCCCYMGFSGFENRDRILALVRQKFGSFAADVVSATLPLPLLAIMLTGCLVADYRLSKLNLPCEFCKKSLRKKLQQIQITLCCPHCGKQILEGKKVRSVNVYRRHLRMQGDRILYFLTWAPVVLGLIVLGSRLLLASPRDPGVIILPVPGFVGTAISSWDWLKTKQRRFLPPMILSFTLFIWGSILFWQLFWKM